MTARTNRRRVLVGALALGLTGVSSGATAEDAALLALGNDLAKLRRRCQRLARQVRRAGDDNASWARWSAAIDERTTLFERIADTQTRGPAGHIIKMKAVIWELLDDDVVMDEAARKRLVALSREFGRLLA